MDLKSPNPTGSKCERRILSGSLNFGRRDADRWCDSTSHYVPKGKCIAAIPWDQAFLCERYS